MNVTVSCVPSLSPNAKLWALEAHVHKTTYGPLIDTALYVIIFDACRSITWASGRGLGPGYLEFLGPEWHSPNGLMPFHRAQKS
jgi:hypothetical protein